MKHLTLEIAAFTLHGVFRAIEGGADRIELCENPNEGGTTPSFGMLKAINTLTTLPVFPIIRPRGGHFVYSAQEYEVMKNDINLCKDLGYKGVVLGLLFANGQIDIERTAGLVNLASPMEVTFHRAFDRSKNPMLALEDIIQCGCTRILTSGQHPSVTNGLGLVKDLLVQAANRIIIMPGSGLNSKNVGEIARKTGAHEFHTAARVQLADVTAFSPSSMNEQLTFISVDEKEVRLIREALDTLDEDF